MKEFINKSKNFNIYGKGNFEKELAFLIKKNIHNKYTDNFFGSKPKLTIRGIIISILRFSGIYFLIKKRERSLLINSFKYLYDRLEDSYSKKLIIQVLAFRLLGHKKIKLPMNDGNYLQYIKEVDKNIINQNDYIVSNFQNKKFYLYNISPYGFLGKIYYTAAGIFHCFVDKAYEHKALNIRAKKGDVVIDAGACYGDTAIYFAELIGDKGKVYSFEFSKLSLTILYKNLSLNRKYQNRIKVVEKPLWSSSGVRIFDNGGGPGNRVTLSNNSQSKQHYTISLDDFVYKEKIKTIDFIKMDIEGAELEALKGSEKVLRRDRPTLAICVYHKITDCYDIPRYIESLDLGYKFYFDHYSVYNEESVLFAKARK
jgi:FkbM family methyltransferase